ncbi:hypothetical protein JJL56_15560 [Azospirillum sp. YIM DDC1]|uniref:Uncharacterized protein n=1 Tax=Azospirillum aestuarii TaxID=2802052 RepID=A0ABS1I0P7_9PROT|nr:hypothetical protein [Azospirillum aestuarii]MBK3777171.1 hypothetical protein [Azospirillum brasilense]MBK4720287.1 hypothetical protein [Azospirillum aestuarii]
MELLKRIETLQALVRETQTRRKRLLDRSNERLRSAEKALEGSHRLLKGRPDDAGTSPAEPRWGAGR